MSGRVGDLSPKQTEALEQVESAVLLYNNINNNNNNNRVHAAVFLDRDVRLCNDLSDE